MKHTGNDTAGIFRIFCLSIAQIKLISAKKSKTVITDIADNSKFMMHVIDSSIVSSHKQTLHHRSLTSWHADQDTF